MTIFGFFVTMLMTIVLGIIIFKLLNGSIRKPKVGKPPANEVTWDSGNHKPHNVQSKGVDITQRLLDLGAPELPEGAKYAFFETLVVRDPDPRFTTLTDTYKNAIALIGPVVDGSKKIYFHADADKIGDYEGGVVSLTEDLHERFMGFYANVQRQDNFKKFLIEGRPNPDLTVIGKDRDWVED